MIKKKKPKSKDSKDPKVSKDPKDSKVTKDSKDTKESKDPKDSKASKDSKDPKDKKSKPHSEDSDTPVRQSRRIAQQKIKEEAERRHQEEVALRELKMIHKKRVIQSFHTVLV